MERTQYPMPIYLNQKNVFDIVAMMEGGISQIEKVKSRQDSSDEALGKLDGNIGVKNGFGFFGLSLGAGRTDKSATKISTEVAHERVYTPNSLFSRMRDSLYDEASLNDNNWLSVPSGGFIELKVRLNRNPLIHTLESIRSFGRLAMIFGSPSKQSTSKSTPGASSASRSGARANENNSDFKKILDQIDELLA